MKKKVKDTDYVKIAAIIFLDKFENENEILASGVLFNKFMTLLHRDLKKEGINLKLPHCWYRWGDEVVRYRMPYLEWDHEYAAYTQVTWKGAAPEYSIEDPIVPKINEYADKFVSKYSGPEGAEMAIGEVYDSAPFEFQNKYRRLRETLKISRNNQPFEKFTKSMLMPLFRDAMDAFPKEFKNLNGKKEDFEEVFRVSIEGGASVADAFDLVEDFWFFFCYYLRLKCNENVPKSTLEVWEDKIPWETESYEHRLQIFAHRFYKEDGSSPNADRLLREWRSDEMEFEELLSRISDDDMKGLEEFTRDLRAGK
ncbi:MAG: hypothetical protein LBM39_01415 [Candidatus Methanoplasma sp.]|jgi:hypothetical protein|nr:hypothetical protein [Candidatus Methanoplasma sp.]